MVEGMNGVKIGPGALTRPLLDDHLGERLREGDDRTIALAA